MAEWLAQAPGWLQAMPEGIQGLLFSLYRVFVLNDNWKFFANGLKITAPFIEQHSIGPGDVRLFLSKARLIVAKRRRSDVYKRQARLPPTDK